MNRNARTTIWMLAVLLIGCGQAYPSQRRDVSLLFWNLQNAFDDHVDGGEYPEYDPSNGKWTTALFRLRLARYAQVLNSLSQIDVLVFVEMESDYFLQQLQRELNTSYPFRFALTTNTPRMGKKGKKRQKKKIEKEKKEKM